MEVSGQPDASTSLLPGKERRLGVPQSWSGHFREEKNLFPLPGFELRIIQFVAQSVSYCTEYAVRAPVIVVNFVNYAPCHGAFCRCILCPSVI